MIIPPRRRVNLGTVWTDKEPKDPGLRVWTSAIQQWELHWPVSPVVLEIGCADTHWLTFAHQYDPTVRGVGVDWRPPQRGPGTRIRGDILSLDLPLGIFDVIVMISTLEHIGLGHYDHDPIDVDGDIHTMQRCAAWLRPGGWIYADVPYNPNGYRVNGTRHRIYDDEALATRLSICPELQRGVALATDLQGVPIMKPELGVPIANERGYVYAALTWKKRGEPDAAETT